MGLPQISIMFKQLASTLIQRSSRGIVAMILKDTKSLGLNEIYESSDVPKDLNEANKNYIHMTLKGNVTAPNKILAYSMGGIETIGEVLEFFETQDFNYLVFPDATEEDKTAIKEWIIKMRDVEKVKIKAILGDIEVSHEGIVNFATTDIEVDAAKYTSDTFTPRIGGLICGTPLSQSITYSKLPEVTGIPKITRPQADALVDKGKLILVKEANAIRIARGVNSYVNAENKDDLLSKIKIVDTLDLMHSDCKKVIVNDYIGKVANSYDNKCLLIVGIREYLQELANEELIEKDFTLDIDIDLQREYLKSNGIDVSKMKEQEIKEANTRSHVFLKGKVTILDAMEDVDLIFEF